MKRIVYHVNDIVRIIKPEIFVRCGYPLTLKMAEDTLITEEERIKIEELLGFKRDFSESVYSSKSYSEMIRALAYNKLIQKGFGGKEKKVYTKLRTNLYYLTGKVTGKRIVQSGTYNGGSGYYTDDGDYDFTQAYLGIKKANVLLTIDIKTQNQLLFGEVVEIEADNVEKL